jgi:hypothetical protein
VLIGCAAAIASLLVFTWETLIVADVLYILSLPVSANLYRRRQKIEASVPGAAKKNG